MHLSRPRYSQHHTTPHCTSQQVSRPFVIAALCTRLCVQQVSTTSFPQAEGEHNSNRRHRAIADCRVHDSTQHCKHSQRSLCLDYCFFLCLTTVTDVPVSHPLPLAPAPALSPDLYLVRGISLWVVSLGRMLRVC